jgi:hypothetical protein
MKRLLPLELVLLAAGACSTPQATTTAAEFWRDALPPAHLEVLPALPPPALATATATEIIGVASVHEALIARSAEFRLQIQPAAEPESEALEPAAAPAQTQLAPLPGMPGLPTAADAPGPVTLLYRLGLGRRLPIVRGDVVHATVWRKPRSDGSVAQGWVVRAGKAGEAAAIVAVVEAGAAIPRDRLPVALRAILPSESVVYQTAERTGDDCDVAVAHLHFHVGVQLQTLAGRKRTRQMVAPGARLRLFDDLGWDVALLDQRRTVGTTCRREPPPEWSWSAVVLPAAAPDATPPDKTQVEK